MQGLSYRFSNEYNEHRFMYTSAVDEATEIFLSDIDGSNTSVIARVHATIHSQVNEFKVKLSFLLMDKITERMPLVKVDAKALDIPKKNISLADSSYETPGNDLSLESSVFWDLLCIGQIKLARHLPVLQKPKPGWIVGGNAPMSRTQENLKGKVFCAVVQPPALQHQIERFWKVEECLPIPKMSEEEIRCEEDFKTTYAEGCIRTIHR